METQKRHLLYGVAVIAALAVSAPVWAQRAGGNSSGGNSMGIPGPNPGGPETPGTPNAGLFGHTPSPPPASTAMPPMHHRAHHVTHMAAHHRNMAPQTGDTANELNQQEVARLQAGSSTPPPAAMPSR